MHADFDHLTGLGTLSVETDVPALLSVPALGLDGSPADGRYEMAVEPWTAEQPRLYDATLEATGETVALRIGFRTVTGGGRPAHGQRAPRSESAASTGTSRTPTVAARSPRRTCSPTSC